MSIQNDVFLAPEALEINRARQEHLAALGLDLAGKRVLEVGAGIGLHTGFFEDRRCAVLSTDARAENVAEIGRRYPHREAVELDLDHASDVSHLGLFDVIYCYGTLYHLSRPEHALRVMAGVCRGLVLIETCVALGEDVAVHLVDEDRSNPNQSYSGTGCRPTRAWVMDALRRHFGYAYVTTHQPCHPDFDLDWRQPRDRSLHRAVFVGSRSPLVNPKLSDTLLEQQSYDPALQREWVQRCLDDPDLSRRVWDMEPRAVHAVAEAVAETRALGPYPRWRFDVEWDSPDPQVRLRRAIWEYFKARRIDEPITVSWHAGLRLRLTMGTDLSSQLFVAGCYEPNEFHFLSRILEPGMVFVDVGANEGLYSLFAAQAVGPEGVALAFEPSERELGRLRANVELNGLGNVTTFPIALSSFNGHAELKIANAEHSGQNTLGAFVWEGVFTAGVERVEVRRLDDVVAALRLPRVDVIKIDVEGSELSVLQGAREVLAASRPLLLVELVDAALQAQGSTIAATLEFLRTLGYEVFSFGETTGRPLPPTGLPLSSNVVAAHPGRTWAALSDREQLRGLVTELRSLHVRVEHAEGDRARLRGELKRAWDELARRSEELQEIDSRLDAARASNEQAQSDFRPGDPTPAQVGTLARLERVEAELAAAESRLTTAYGLIAAMESTRSWKLRRAWVALRRALASVVAWK